MLDEAQVAAEAEEERVAAYRRHKYFFGLAMLFSFFAAEGIRFLTFLGLSEGPGAVVGRLLISVSSLVGVWFSVASGRCAVRARQHMFRSTPRMSNDMAFVTGSKVGASSVWIVAGLLWLWGAVLFVLAAWVWVHGAFG